MCWILLRRHLKPQRNEVICSWVNRFSWCSKRNTCGFPSGYVFWFCPWKFRLPGRRRRGRQTMRWLDSIQGTWVWVNSGRQWRTGKSGMLQSMGLQSWTWLSDWTATSAEGKHSELELLSLISQLVFCQGEYFQKGVHFGLGRAALSLLMGDLV